MARGRATSAAVLGAAVACISGCYGSRVPIGELCARRPVEDAGTIDGAGLDVPPPRLRSPVSGAILTSRRPVFEWTTSGETPGARIEVCLDRACTTVVASLDAANAARTIPDEELPSGVLFWRARGLRGPAVGFRTSATWAMRVPPRSAPIATASGLAVDLDGDGFGDTAVGADRATRVYTYHGSASGPSTAPTAERIGPPRFALTAAGDLDGDGYHELVVGAYQGGDTHEGVVLVYRGSPTGIEASPSRTLVGADGVGGFFGSSLAAGADYNGDGYGDLVVGAYGSGRVHVYYGSECGVSPEPSLTLGEPAGGAGEFGIAFGGLSDVDGDGRHDLVVAAAGASARSGRVYVYRGAPGALTSSPYAVLSGDDAAGDFGYALATGDVDGDGATDVAVGAQYDDAVDGGAVYVFAGRSGGPPRRLARIGALHGDGGRTGVAVRIGDFDGDGLGDLAIGSFVSVGFVDVWPGGSSYEGPPTTAIGGTAGDVSHFGTALGAGDLDRDGDDDLVAGAQNADGGVGRADVYLGSAAGLGIAPSVVLPSPAGPGGRFGIVVLP